MNRLKKLIHALLHDRKKIAIYLYQNFLCYMMSDEVYLKHLFKLYLGKPLNLDNPRTFSEKIQWLKLYNRNPRYTMMTDKYAVKEYVAEKIGREYIIPTLGVWDTPEQIDFDSLPRQFVLKTTHGGGSNGVFICKDKSRIDRKKISKQLKESLSKDLYQSLKDWSYKNVKRRIIAEEYISDNINEDLHDYKFFCFNGEPKYCQVIAGRDNIMTVDFYDKEWKHMPFHEPKIYPFSEQHQTRPDQYNQMWQLATILSQGMPFVRVDFYNLGNKIYFGELTFYPSSGIGGFEPEEWDYTFGDMITLPTNKVQ